MQRCKYCDSLNVAQIVRTDVIHYGEYRCLDCDIHLGWIKKPTRLRVLIEACQTELERLGYDWQSNRVLNWCKRACGNQSYLYLREGHLEALLHRLKEIQE